MRGFILTLFLAAAAQADPVQFNTGAYNFALDGGGGGVAGLLGAQNVETFCVDFNNDIHASHSDYSAYLSTLTPGSDLSHTRFASNSAWQTVTINDGDSNDATDSAIINGAGALGRYQMAAFLVSEYQTAQGSNAYNNGIQDAIWEILDPSSYPASPKYANTSDALELASEWYANPNSDKSFLSDFLIVSDATMTVDGTGNPLAGGFQEQITMLAPVPEPRATAWILIGLFFVGVVSRRCWLPLAQEKASS